MISGLRLSRRFYTHVVAPQLSGIRHSAALLGWGSDVLGYDTARSTDHGWGPRVLVFTDQRPPELELPVSFDGVPVRFGWAGVEPRSWVTVTRLDEWLLGQLGVDATGEIDVLDWLLFPQQRLLGVTAGAVFADPDGSLVAVRSTLTWYPDEVWRWLLACQWQRIALRSPATSTRSARRTWRWRAVRTRSASPPLCGPRSATTTTGRRG